MNIDKDIEDWFRDSGDPTSGDDRSSEDMEDVASFDDEAIAYDENQEALWIDYRVTCRYEADNHVYMIPIAYPYGWTPESETGEQVVEQTPTVAFVKLASKTLLLIADWSICKAAEEPTKPNPYPPQESKWVLLDEIYEPALLQVGKDGVSVMYRFSGTYIYGCTCPNELTFKDLTYPVAPWMREPTAQGEYTRSVDSETLDDDIIFESQSAADGSQAEMNSPGLLW